MFAVFRPLPRDHPTLGGLRFPKSLAVPSRNIHMAPDATMMAIADEMLEQLTGAQIASAFVQGGLHIRFVDGRVLILMGDFQVAMANTDTLH
jgi:hypothetical protein